MGADTHPAWLWTLDELLAATGGQAIGQMPAGISGINFDSRLIAPGDLFLALPSEDGLRDGHDFVAAAFTKGAALALVSRALDDSHPQLLVPDVLQALEQLGTAARERSQSKRIAVTGSVGKTSVTRAILSALQLAGRAHGPDGSFNNHIGVPLTLARMPRATERAVFEIGMNHANEITPLARMVAPHAAVITNVGPVHTENFPDGEMGVARAKAEIFAGLAPSGVAILPRDSQWYDLLAEAAQAAGARTVGFGAHAEAEACLLEATVSAEGLTVTARLYGEPVTYSMQQAGQHWALNSLAVLLTCTAADVPQDTTLAALAELQPIAGRGARHELLLPDGTARLIDESYNANPLSMAAALRLLGGQSPAEGGRRIAVLTDMLELGPDAPARHAALAADIAANGVDLVFCAGPLMQALWDALPATRRGGYAPTAAELLPVTQEAVQAGDVIMVKGSKGSKASTLVTALLARYGKATA